MVLITCSRIKNRSQAQVLRYAAKGAPGLINSLFLIFIVETFGKLVVGKGYGTTIIIVNHPVGITKVHESFHDNIYIPIFLQNLLQ